MQFDRGVATESRCCRLEGRSLVSVIHVCLSVETILRAMNSSSFRWGFVMWP